MADKITEQIQGFIKKTEEKKVDWKLLSPTVVRFSKQIDSNTLIATLQSQGVPPNITYIFTIQGSNPSVVLLQIQTSAMPQYKNDLTKLFELAMGDSKINSSKEIDDLLNSI